MQIIFRWCFFFFFSGLDWNERMSTELRRYSLATRFAAFYHKKPLYIKILPRAVAMGTGGEW